MIVIGYKEPSQYIIPGSASSISLSKGAFNMIEQSGLLYKLFERFSIIYIKE